MQQTIGDFVGEYSKTKETATSWGMPLVAFAAAEDPLFQDLKRVVSESHATPKELMPGARTVIAYFIPFHRSVALSNLKGNLPSREWVRAYVETNALIVALNEYLERFLGERGFSAYLVPPTHNFDREKLVSGWSHRHVAYVAGLGRFGLNRQLITEKGCCGRLGSLVTDMEIVPTLRPTEEFCLYMGKGDCKACVARCFSGALDSGEFNRRACYEVLRKNAEIYRDEGLADACGKCVSRVPCSFVNPVKRKKKEEMAHDR